MDIVSSSHSSAELLCLLDSVLMDNHEFRALSLRAVANLLPVVCYALLF